MQNRLVGNDWQKTIWKLLTNPAFEVVAAIVVVVFAAWIVIQTETDNRTEPIPVLLPR